MVACLIETLLITTLFSDLCFKIQIEPQNENAMRLSANYTLLLERMAQVGAGAGRAETRRGWVRTEEEKMKRDREAQWLARVRGVGLVHKGRFFR
jgi:hypothetical protein